MHGPRRPAATLLALGALVSFVHPSHPDWLKVGWGFLGLALIVAGTLLAFDRPWRWFFAAYGTVVAVLRVVSILAEGNAWRFVGGGVELLMWPSVALAAFGTLSNIGVEDSARTQARLAVGLVAWEAVAVVLIASNGGHEVDGALGMAMAFVFLGMTLGVCLSLAGGVPGGTVASSLASTE